MKLRGSALILTFFFIVLLTMEVALIALIAQRSLGEEGIMLADNIQARQGLSVAMWQAEQKLYSYIRQNGAGNVTVDFAYGGGAAITDQSITSTDPENAGAGETVDTGVDISAWVSARRGVWYKITAVSKIDQVELTAHKWVRVNPCNTVGGLTTIADGLRYPGVESVVADANGRVFFGESNDPGNFYTWSSATGLSTLATGLIKPGYKSIVIGDDDRVFWGEDGNAVSFWSWHEDTGLSVIATGGNNYGSDYAVNIDNNTGRVFFRNGNRDMLSWHEATGLSTLVENAGGNIGIGGTLVTSSGRAYFGSVTSSGSQYYTWHESTGLTIIMDGSENLGRLGFEGSTVSGERVFFASDDNSGATLVDGVWTWHPSTGLSTILSPAFEQPARRAINADANGRVFIGQAEDPGSVWTWHASTGLSILHTGLNQPGWRNLMVTSDGRAFYNGGSNGDPYWTWHASTGLSTLIASENDPGQAWAHFLLPDGRVYFSEGHAANGGSFWTWHEDSGLTTIGGIFNKVGQAWTVLGYGKSIQAFSNMRVLAADRQSNAVYTWHPDTGLSTIIQGETMPGHISIAANEEAGMFFFGEDVATGGGFWAWTPPASCADRGY